MDKKYDAFRNQDPNDPSVLRQRAWMTPPHALLTPRFHHHKDPTLFEILFGRPPR